MRGVAKMLEYKQKRNNGRHSNRGLITKGTIGSPVGKRPPCCTKHMRGVASINKRGTMGGPRLPVFTSLCVCVCVCTAAAGYEYSYIWGIRPIRLFLRFSGEKFNNVFKSVCFTGLTRSMLHVGGAINSTLTDCAQYTETDTAIIQT